MATADTSDNHQVPEYEEKHAVEILKYLNNDRKSKHEFCDGTLMTDGGQHPVHKCIVGALSGFFHGMFTIEMQEKYKTDYNISNLACDTVDGILDYIYTGVAHITDDNVCELLDGADFTQVIGLRTKCSDHLWEIVDLDNCLRLRVFAHRYNLESVLEKADRLIAANFAEVLQQEDFRELPVDDLVPILSLEKQKEVEDTVYRSIIVWTNHNLTFRHELFEKMFSLVDISLLSEDLVTDVIAQEHLVKISPQCQIHLNERRHGRPDPQIPDKSKVAIIGGRDREKQVTTYDILSHKKELWPKIIRGRYGGTSTTSGWYMYAIGGGVPITRGIVYKRAERMHLKYRQKWEELPDMAEYRQYAASCGMDGDVYVSGGSCDYERIKSCEKFDFKQHCWLPMGDMRRPRTEHAMIALNGLIYVIGGFDGFKNTAAVEVYDFANGVWMDVAPINEPRNGVGSTTWNGCIYITGGWGEIDIVSTMERYDPAVNQWTLLRPITPPRCGHGMDVINNRIYISGGCSGEKDYSTTVEVYDEEANTWSFVFDMKEPYQEASFLSM